jgi:hypothetical protein
VRRDDEHGKNLEEMGKMVKHKHLIFSNKEVETTSRFEGRNVLKN